MRMKDRLTGIGAIGAGVTALCCVTPVLVWLVAAFGAGALAIYLDAVLLPLLAIFLVMIGVGLWRKRKTSS